MSGRGALVAAFGIAGAVSVALGPACVDLFHSTDFEDLCDRDAHASGCPGADARVIDAGSEAYVPPTDFCTWSSSTARTHAEHACAWLGACTAPFDENALGTCMIDAILAYDCHTNPNLVIAPGPLHAYWDALWQARSCADVTAVVNPKNIACTSTGFGCGGTISPATRFECVDNKGGPESCLASGRVCLNNACEPAGALAECEASTCSGTVLHDCEDGGDLGYDCQYFGAGSCVVDDAGATCTPLLTSDTCPLGSATNVVSCSDDIATSCPTGTAITIDCSALAGPSSCKSGTPSPVYDLPAACQGSAACTPDCDGDKVIGCAQGAKFTVSCSAEQLGACHEVPLPESVLGFACAPP
jgi:hypothetical protein